MTASNTRETRALSADPARAMQDMMSTIDALRAVYAEETLALKSSDSPAFFALQDKKIHVAQEYHDRLSAFVARKDEMLKTNPDLKSLLRKKQAEFNDTSRENLEALDRMRRTVDRLGARIMKAARYSGP